MVGQVHDGHTGQLPDPPLEVLITRGHNVRLMLGDPIHQTVVSIRTLNRTPESYQQYLST